MIGVFDSGFGGLTILKHLLKKLPDYDYLYLGDSARVPYGGKSPELIYKYSCEAVDFLFGAGCNLIIFACNTASAQALRRIQQEYLPSKYPGKNVLGVIRPIAEAVGANKKIKRIGVIGTSATIKSGIYEDEIKKINPDAEIFASSAPLLVPLTEEGWIKKPETKMILKKYLRPLKNKKIQTLILGCTHYPLLLKEIKSVMGKSCAVFDPGEIVADSLADYLSRHSEFSSKSSSPQIKFYTTDSAEKFKEAGEKFLGKKIEKVERAEL